jgi:periplasmic protein TonB
MKKTYDWKDLANAQFSKALALAVTAMLFAFLITPSGESRASKDSVSQATMAEAPPDTRQKEDTPQDQEIQINIPVISEELATEDTPELQAERALALQQFGDLQSTTSSSLNSGGDERPFDFVPYDEPPVVIGRINPSYPDFARRAGIQGTVMLAVNVYKDGSIGEINVLKSVQAGPGGLDEAAIAAIRSVRFQPGMSSGNPVDTTVNIPVEFRLGGN